MKPDVIYLQKGFWKQLQADTSIAGLQCMMNVYEAISGANLRTDIEDEVWDCDPFLILLWKKYLTNQSDIELYDNLEIGNPQKNAEDLSAVYLTKESRSTCELLETNYGVVTINNTELPKKEYLFKGDGFMLRKDHIRYKDRYMQFKDKIFYPCNTMILIDPYILSKKENVENSLFYLLDAILPQKLQIKFQLAVFSMIGEKNRDYARGKDVHTQLENLIKALRKGLEFDLTLYAIGPAEGFHSRMIITNNVLFSAADGFDVFDVYKGDGSSNKNAKFDIVMPRLVGDSRLDMSNYLRWIKVAKEKSRSQSKTQMWGKPENRLFELV